MSPVFIGRLYWQVLHVSAMNCAGLNPRGLSKVVGLGHRHFSGIHEIKIAAEQESQPLEPGILMAEGLIVSCDTEQLYAGSTQRLRGFRVFSR